MIAALVVAAVLWVTGEVAGWQPDAAADRAGQEARFEGRYRRGPEVSPVRIVLFTDYQCPDCDVLDRVLEPILAERPEYAVSVKHFPFSNACNPHVPQNQHPNACWAARAAEAAGMLRGSDGFWAMHRWLFSRRGSFTDAELRNALAGMGYSPDEAAEFERVMTGPETLARVQADIAEGMRLGLFSTPMLFVNGREVKNVRDAAAVRGAIEAAVARGEPGPAADDRPPTAEEKVVEDWRAQPRVALPEDPRRWLGAAEGARVSIVMWGDAVEPNSVRAEAEIRRLLAARGDVRYAFLQFPTEQGCNPAMPRTVHAGACAAAVLVESAQAAGGAELARRVRAAIARLTPEQRAGLGGGADVAAALRVVAPLDVQIAERSEAIAAAAAQGAEGVRADIEAARGIGITAVPMIVVNGRRVPRWMVGERPVLELIVEAAAGE